MTSLQIFGLALGGIALLTAGTYALPRHVSVERVATLSASPDQILALAASNQGYQRFNPYKDMDPKLKIDLFGPESGVGSGFAFHGKDGQGRQTVADVGTDRVVYAIDLGPMGTPTQSITAQAVAGGSKVTWRMDSDLGFNPIFRVFGLFMDRMVGRSFEIGLEKLGRATA
ncbi:MAG: SRPBCC family protein [Pseudomonadota bacterium]